ncbi:TlpA family protein disulfide reductase [Nocardioides terrigena]|uniref:TlpA family protein disulfide reductase n=1 Tax=Nocardioides terrigena TaxID=424797 RepID=UPI00131ED9CE|nr:TlpA disulfide reductase family protein [Nocardioides terrigena]
MSGLAIWVTLSWADPPTTGRGTGDAVIQQYAVAERVDLADFEGALLDGTNFSSADMAGRVAVYNVWGSWCVPCRTEAPDLIRVAEEYADDVSFVGINVRDGLDAAQAFERRLAVPYPSLRAEDSDRALLAFGSSVAVAAVPTTVVVDRAGGIAARIVGPTTYSTLKALLDEVVTEAGEPRPRSGPHGR